MYRVGGRLRRYECVCPTAAGFVQQLALGYITHGYLWYAAGTIPERRMDLRETDEKVITQYHTYWSSAERSRRKKAGKANVQYLRHGRFYVICATDGEHEFYDGDGRSQEDIRFFPDDPLYFAGYSISYKNGHVSVRIADLEYQRLQAWLEDIATKRSSEALERTIFTLPFEPWDTVVRQLSALRAAVNRKRHKASMPEVPASAVRACRRQYFPYLPLEEQTWYTGRNKQLKAA